MRIAFMGTPDFAADILDLISDSVDVACVYTKPDAIRGRGKKLIASPVKEMAEHLGIEVRQPRTLKDEDEIAYLKSLSLDAICVAAYGLILPAEVLSIPRFGCLNVHASLLPRWRGAAPIERAILAGDEFAGVCIMRMEEGLDTGDYCISRSIPIESLSAKELTRELAGLGASSLLSALVHIESGSVKWVSQDESLVTYANRIDKGELNINPSLEVMENLRRIQASSESHPAKCDIVGRRVSVIAATMPDGIPGEIENAAAGDVVYVGKKVYLMCSNGAFELLKVKPDGRSEMDANSFAAGSADIRSGAASWSAI